MTITLESFFSLLICDCSKVLECQTNHTSGKVSLKCYRDDVNYGANQL